MLRLPRGEFFGQPVGLRQFGAFTVTASRYRPGERLPRHCHERAYLYIMLDGCMRERSLCRQHDCTRGWVVYNQAGEPHEDHVLERGAEGLNIEFDTQWLTGLEAPDRPDEPLTYRHVGAAVPAIGVLRLAMNSRDRLRELAAEEAIVGLVGALGRSRIAARSAPSWLGRAEELLRDTRDHTPGLAAIAREAGVHPSHLCREFSRRHGCTMTQYTARLRADAALQEIIASDMPLAGIASRHGFADQSHMTRSMNTYFGTTPAQVRRERSEGAASQARKRCSRLPEM